MAAVCGSRKVSVNHGIRKPRQISSCRASRAALAGSRLTCQAMKLLTRNWLRMRPAAARPALIHSLICVMRPSGASDSMVPSATPAAMRSIFSKVAPA